MPTLNDYDANDEDSGGADDGYTPAQAASTGGGDEPKAGSPSTAQNRDKATPGYVAWDALSNANQEVSQRESGKLQGQVQGDVDKAQKGLQGAQDAFNAGIDANYQKPSKPTSVKNATLEPIGGSDRATANNPSQPAPQADAGNPWASFLPGATEATSSPAAPNQGRPQKRGMEGAATPQQMQDKLAAAQRPFDLSAAAAAGNPTGAQDLEHTMSGEAWQGLIGDTKKASAEAGLIGSETGVGTLLDQGRLAPTTKEASTLDAALINQAGNHGFQQLNQQFGNDQLKNALLKGQEDSQSRWKQLQGDVAARQAADKAFAANQANQPPPEEVAPETPAEAAAATAEPDDGSYSLRDILWPDGDGDFLSDSQFMSTVHQLALSMSPADWATFAIGLAGKDMEPASEIYVKNFGGMNGKQNWAKGNFQMAWGILNRDGFSPEAKSAFMSALKKNPEMLQSYLSMKNPGFMLRNMREWMKSAGFQPNQGQLGTSQSEGHVRGATSGEDVNAVNEQINSGNTEGAPPVYYGGFADGKTDEDFETRRNQASDEGWLTEFDEQARKGERYPKKPGT